MSNLNLKVFIEEKSQEIIQEDTNYNIKLGFYSNIKDKNLSMVFSHFHYHLNELFKFMNSKNHKNSKHFNSLESKHLLAIIDSKEALFNALKNSKYSFKLDEYYENILKQCKEFLVPHWGSPIPEDFDKITIIEIKPIFTMNSTITISEERKFELKIIGEGSYAKVFKYKDTFYNKFFAKKKAKKSLNEKEKLRLKQEFESMKQLNSPYIIEVYTFDEKELSYIMEYADMTLYTYIIQNNTKINNTQRKSLINQILKAFEYINNKIGFHRDISFTNILLKKYDTDLYVVKVSDFGLLKLKNSTLTSVNTEYKGSLNDPKLDIIGGFKDYKLHHETFALTRLIYFIMTGKERITTYHNKDFELFIKNGISDNSEKRYHSIVDMKSLFNRINFN
jgi:hypothetical protein